MIYFVITKKANKLIKEYAPTEIYEEYKKVLSQRGVNVD